MAIGVVLVPGGQAQHTSGKISCFEGRSSHANQELLDLGDYANLVPTTRERSSLMT